MDIADAECVLEDLVSKSRVVASTRQISNEVNKEGDVPRLGEMDFCTEAGQAGQSGSTTGSHDVEQKTLHA